VAPWRRQGGRPGRPRRRAVILGLESAGAFGGSDLLRPSGLRWEGLRLPGAVSSPVRRSPVAVTRYPGGGPGHSPPPVFLRVAITASPTPAPPALPAGRREIPQVSTAPAARAGRRCTCGRSRGRKGQTKDSAVLIWEPARQKKPEQGRKGHKGLRGCRRPESVVAGGPFRPFCRAGSEPIRPTGRQNPAQGF
jgi:hypothetical protein